MGAKGQEGPRTLTVFYFNTHLKIWAKAWRPQKGAKQVHDLAIMDFTKVTISWTEGTQARGKMGQEGNVSLE